MDRKILFINACVRPESRTSRLARKMLGLLKGHITEIDIANELAEGNIAPLDDKFIRFRMECSAKRDFSDMRFRCARMFAEADVIIIAAPYWDLSFPAALKIFLENVCVDQLTFKYSEKGYPIGLCKAKDIAYISTSGGPVYGDYGAGYVKTLCNALLGIKNFHLVQAENLDVYGNDPEKILEDKYHLAEEIAERINGER